MTRANSGEATSLNIAVTKCAAHGMSGRKEAACAMSIAMMANPRRTSGMTRRSDTGRCRPDRSPGGTSVLSDSWTIP